MKNRNPTIPFLLLVSLATLLSLFFFLLSLRVMSQTRPRTVNAGETPALPANGGQVIAPADGAPEVVKVDVDLVTVDALVLQKNTARVFGGLKKEDFVLMEDGRSRTLVRIVCRS